MLHKHEKIAFEFSGGKDSLAALYALKPHWDRFTVYWLDTGDAVPEVREFVQRIALTVPHFKVIHGRQPEVIAAGGWPTDLVPADATVFGAAALGHGLLLQSRNDCCFNSLMWPMHQAVVADGNTLIIRGQKLTDKRKAPVKSGYVDPSGVAYWFPIEDWTDADVRQFLQREAVALPEFYQWLSSSPDCLHCTAYWDERRGNFLRENHPEAWQTVSFRLKTIAAASLESFRELENFLNVEE